ncbi:MAG: DUF2778 domain-containing protein, partial [Luteibacter sp.]
SCPSMLRHRTWTSTLRRGRRRLPFSSLPRPAVSSLLCGKVPNEPSDDALRAVRLHKRIKGGRRFEIRVLFQISSNAALVFRVLNSKARCVVEVAPSLSLRNKKFVSLGACDGTRSIEREGMLICRFRLDNLPLSAVTLGARTFPAFSGEERYVNNSLHQCMPNGPIPRGTYYIVNRESGGRLGTSRDKVKKADLWFALYADDLKVDDQMFCDKVMRGQLRLHPSGWTGQSAGCVTLPFMSDFLVLRRALLSHVMVDVPRADMQAYGQLVVS